MRCRSWIGVSATLVVLAWTVVALCQVAVPDVQTVTVWGESATTDDVAADKRLAVAHARRTAVERVVGSYVTSETLVQNYQVVEDRIYSRAAGFINSYQILEEQRGATQKVRVQAQVSLVPVAEILRASGLLRGWRVGVLMNLDAAARADMLTYTSRTRILEVARTIEATIGRQLVDAGFKVMDPSRLETLRRELDRSGEPAGETLRGMDLLVTGSVSLAVRGSGGTLHQAVCQVQGKILRVDTGEIVYQGNVGNSFDGVTLLVDRSLAMKYAGSLGNGLLSDGTPDLRSYGAGQSAALDKAVHLTSALVADVMVSQITRLPAAVSATIALELHGLDFSQFLDLEEYLKTLEGVSNVTAEEFAGGVQNMEVQYDGEAMALGRTLGKSSFCATLNLKVTSVTKNKIVMKTQ